MRRHVGRTEGLVYFVRCTSTGLVKIGWSNDVPARMNALRSATHPVLVLEGTRPGGHFEEQRIHRLLAPQRVSGEWFRATPDEVCALVNAPSAVMGERSDARRALAAIRFRQRLAADTVLDDLATEAGIALCEVQRIAAGQDVEVGLLARVTHALGLADVLPASVETSR